jgi:hypothetical protein
MHEFQNWEKDTLVWGALTASAMMLGHGSGILASVRNKFIS